MWISNLNERGNEEDWKDSLSEMGLGRGKGVSAIGSGRGKNGRGRRHDRMAARGFGLT